MSDSIKKKIAVFASGRGSNALQLIQKAPEMSYAVELIVTNKPDAAVLKTAEEYNIAALVLDRKFFYESENLVDDLKNAGIEFIVLAGFLWLIPEYLINAFKGRIVNIHPSLLPKYGGKGMYGMKVHEAVWQNKEKESGITIHLVNKEYDKGEILLQESVLLSEEDTPESIAEKVLKLEHQYLPLAVNNLVKKF